MAVHAPELPYLWEPADDAVLHGNFGRHRHIPSHHSYFTSQQQQHSPSQYQAQSSRLPTHNQQSAPAISRKQFFRRLRRHFEYSMFFSHVESLLHKSNLVFFLDEKVVRPSIHFYLILTEEFCRAENLVTFLGNVRQRDIGSEWTVRLTHTCHVFYVTARSLANAFSVFDGDSGGNPCDNDLIDERWNDTIEKTRSSIDLLRPEVSMCHSPFGCTHSALYLDKASERSRSQSKNFNSGMLDLSSLNISSLHEPATLNVLPLRAKSRWVSERSRSAPQLLSRNKQHDHIFDTQDIDDGDSSGAETLPSDFRCITPVPRSRDSRQIVSASSSPLRRSTRKRKLTVDALAEVPHLNSSSQRDIGRTPEIQRWKQMAQVLARRLKGRVHLRK